MNDQRSISVVALAVLVFGFFVSGAGVSFGQERVGYYDYARPDLKWFSIETEHFLIHYHADENGLGSDRTAEVVARIAEEIYEPVTALYELEPDVKVSIVLKDFEDYSNGAAYFLDNKIDIWAPSLQTPLRGESSWLRNVITHEFTHIVQVQKTLKGSRRVPFYYVQWLHYEDVRRPDVLYGYPDGIISYPIPILNNPAWFAEGTAQYQRADLHYDRWDTHRDMLLRARLLDGKGLTIGEMGDLRAKTTLEREQVYNQGFAFTTHLANQYGEESLREVSDKLGNWLNWTIESAISDAVGEPGDEVFRRWANGLEKAYAEQTEAIRAHQVSGRIVESDGFLNLSPRFSPDGSSVAWISNKGSDYSFFALHTLSLDTGDEHAFDFEGSSRGPDHTTCSLGHALVGSVTGSISWNSDGQEIAFARTLDTDIGHRYADLFSVNVQTEKSERITRNARATQPAFEPRSNRIVYVTQSDGSTNLKLITAGVDEASEPEADGLLLTQFADGSQVYAPVWSPDGAWIYFAKGPNEGGRNIFRVKPDGSGLSPVIDTPGDDRDPALSPDGKWLYFASDRTGIFNIFRMDLSTRDVQQVTSVLGGAFMPDVSVTGKVVYALFNSDGYKIAVLDNPEPVESRRYTPPDVLTKQAGEDDRFDWAALNDFDDSDLHGLAPPEIAQEVDSPAKYDNAFTSFQFYPVLRFDMYADANRSGIDMPGEAAFQGGKVLRSTKIGVYTNSRDILDGLSFSAGVLIGPWSKSWDSIGEFFAPSRIEKLERDLFLRFDYRKGLPFFKKRWAPQLSVEFYNIVRNVENGLEIEEFPCTACYPDTTYADIAYSLWEVDVYSRSKLSRSTMLEFGYRYSPYRVRTEAFFSEEEGLSIPASSTRYFIGHTLGTKLYLDRQRPHLNDDVMQLGWRGEVAYEYQPGQLLEAFAVENGILVPNYVNSRNHQFLADFRWDWILPFGGRTAAHGLGLRARGTTIIGGEVDDFYNDYVGGLVGARGYPFYALGGNETMWIQLAYQFPIFPRIKQQFLFLHFNKLYARVYGDAAAAWSGSWPGIDAVRKDVGAELRLGISSFYLLPTAAFVSATYSIDEFVSDLAPGFITPDGSRTVQYGKEVLWHFGVLFEFDL